MRGALIPLAVLGLVYRYGVRPMIGRRNDVGSLLKFSNTWGGVNSAMMACPSINSGNGGDALLLACGRVGMAFTKVYQ